MYNIKENKNKNLIFYKNEETVFNNYQYVYSISDIHGDFDKFIEILIDIGKDKKICKDDKDNIFIFYNKTIYGETFKLCKIIKNNVKNFNFAIVQLGDIIMSFYKTKYNPYNKELDLILLILSLINSFKIINQKCKYIQILGNHDILTIVYNKKTALYHRLCNLKLHFNNQRRAYNAYIKLRKLLFTNGYVLCKINDTIYSHYLYSKESLDYLISKYNKFNNDQKILNILQNYNNIIDNINYYIKTIIFHNFNIPDKENYTKLRKYFINDQIFYISDLEYNNNSLFEYYKKSMNCKNIIIGHRLNLCGDIIISENNNIILSDVGLSFYKRQYLNNNNFNFIYILNNICDNKIEIIKK
jgi:hypothetical protein